MSFAITENNNILHIKLAGHISNADLVALDKELFEHWDAPNIKGHVYDYLATTTFNFSEDEIKSIAVLDTNESFISGRLNIAIVANDPEILHFSRIYVQNMHNSDWTVEIFETLEAGLAFCHNSVQ
ncbi:MAG: hypothetical protein ACFHVJ_02905 [Aestuariibacter sp.]